MKGARVNERQEIKGVDSHIRINEAGRVKPLLGFHKKLLKVIKRWRIHSYSSEI